MSPVVLSVILCAAAAMLEGLLAGGSVKQRFAELRLPTLSPPLSIWVAIGVVYYVICFVILYRLLAHGLPAPRASVALGLLLAVMLLNAAWGYLFFRRRSVRGSFFALFPYSLLVLALAGILVWVDWMALVVLLPYLAYLGYALWWTHRLFRLNETAALSESRLTDIR